MAYTAPSSISAGQVFTASRWNTEVKDNITYLKAPDSLFVGGATSVIGEQVGIRGAAAFFLATDNTNATSCYFGSTSATGFAGTYTNKPFEFRTNNTNVLSFSAAGLASFVSLPVAAAGMFFAPLIGRKGGSSTVWNTAGTTSYNNPDGVIQVGSNNITINTTLSNTLVTSFHTTFAQVPLVLWSLETTVGNSAIAANITAKTTSSFSLFINNGTVANLTFTINWIAIGPR